MASDNKLRFIGGANMASYIRYQYYASLADFVGARCTEDLNTPGRVLQGLFELPDLLHSTTPTTPTLNHQIKQFAGRNLEKVVEPRGAKSSIQGP